ncbi:PhzF family phenazine biosynthesis protein [Paenibacillus sp. 1001270B_150601_E10]|uniref:PhzF family phenazine biosynthesis protein n=1 Tax=Paenibacillus sp. 1001270B_150601_E10 TaxID=2787079 RepID=UPI00226D1D19|nr:PhzF family phenazine biosynthesis protein [Paenibacillus sp. 1001270B_150601_E10]
MSLSIEVLHIDAFTTIPNMGNPAGVVLHAEVLTPAQMQEIAKRVGFNETVFVLPSSEADVKLKYYTPGHEMNLCGHATMAAIYALANHDPERESKERLDQLTVETNVGILPITVRADEHSDMLIQMQQARPQFIPFEGDKERLMWSMGLNQSVLHSELPIVYGSTGIWTLLIPLANLDCFSRMEPKNEHFPELLTEMPRASLHPFCMGAHDVKAFMHARHFSSPYSGTIEDPATGTASGVMGAYYMQYAAPELTNLSFTVEQGTEIGKDGRVHVEAKRNGGHVDIYVAGTAAYVSTMTIELEGSEITR